jgi:hypothetical protein
MNPLIFLLDRLRSNFSNLEKSWPNRLYCYQRWIQEGRQISPDAPPHEQLSFPVTLYKVNLQKKKILSPPIYIASYL